MPIVIHAVYLGAPMRRVPLALESADDIDNHARPVGAGAGNKRMMIARSQILQKVPVRKYE
jgi:hypothetical protein